MKMYVILRNIMLYWLFLVECAAFSPAATMVGVNSRSTSSFPGSLQMVPDENVAVSLSSSLISSYSSSPMLVSQGSGAIDWSNPFEAVGGGILLAYFTFSILAGLKYIVDGWRPKM
eukprot:CAMPEP_0198252490 /NCGR_PEP_ID=MMETSP1447-20131203/2995_1 /TAXON_ID=420782 /ORGANISM="Chaetoceros dichaeta, Strain CCMP1751" /LENGTH=115 /DNA_ID=CAMNT_0043937769 /DNA_START=23 /DNA_END=370 /DNA_ORIENTATION=-